MYLKMLEYWEMSGIIGDVGDVFSELYLDDGHFCQSRENYNMHNAIYRNVTVPEDRSYN